MSTVQKVPKMGEHSVMCAAKVQLHGVGTPGATGLDNTSEHQAGNRRMETGTVSRCGGYKLKKREFLC